MQNTYEIDYSNNYSNLRDPKNQNSMKNETLYNQFYRESKDNWNNYIDNNSPPDFLKNKEHEICENVNISTSPTKKLYHPEKEIKEMNEKIYLNEESLIKERNENNNNKNIINSSEINSSYNYAIKQIANFDSIKDKQIENELSDLKLKYITLKNDNIIFKEDIFRISEINKNLEREIDIQRKHNLSLAHENSKLNETNISLNNKINDTISKLALYRQNSDNYINNISNNSSLGCYSNGYNIIKSEVFYRDRMLKQNYEFNKLNSEKNRLEIDYHLLVDKFNKLKLLNSKKENELNILKEKQDIKLNEIENKINEFMVGIKKLKNENLCLEKENNEFKNQLSKIIRDKEDVVKNYKNQSIINSDLNKEIENIKNLVMMYKNEIKIENERKSDTNKKRKNVINNKKKIIQEFQDKIKKYKELQVQNNLQRDNDEY